MTVLLIVSRYFMKVTPIAVFSLLANPRTASRLISLKWSSMCAFLELLSILSGFMTYEMK